MKKPPRFEGKLRGYPLVAGLFNNPYAAGTAQM